MLIPIIRSTSCNLLHGTPVIRTVTTTNSTRCLWAAEHKTQPAPHWGPHASAKAIRPLVVETAGSSPGQSTPGSDPFSYSDCDTLRTTNNKRNKLLKIPKEDGNRTPCEHRQMVFDFKFFNLGCHGISDLFAVPKRSSWKLLNRFNLWLVGWFVHFSWDSERPRRMKASSVGPLPQLQRQPWWQSLKQLETKWNDFSARLFNAALYSFVYADPCWS